MYISHIGPLLLDTEVRKHRSLTSSLEGEGSMKLSGLLILNMTLSTLNCEPLVKTE